MLITSETEYMVIVSIEQQLIHASKATEMAPAQALPDVILPILKITEYNNLLACITAAPFLVLVVLKNTFSGASSTIPVSSNMQMLLCTTHLVPT